ncbi:MAG: MBOAT family protein [Lachnospiraceae bacterium]|nr:MBOAT family protein [Lachnospiraceae bacterium]
MLFNSYIFIFLFLPLALAGWYLLNQLEKYTVAQIFLIAMSLWFYAYFDVSYLAVILTSCVVNYLFSFLLTKRDSEGFKKGMLFVGCVVNLGILGYFKYYDFFLENLNAVLHTDFTLKNILLPLGISFFTFQQLSFVIDRCKGDAPHYSLADYLNFVTFFPQLIAGPIVLHSELIPQFQDKARRKFDTDSFAQGIAYFSIGMGKKVLLADTLAKAVNYGFGDIAGLDTVSALVVALAYTFELYFDFSGYCDMAIGIGKMFHIEIPDNFDAPYKSASVKEFWRRWHMTLGRFFTTYVYIPLGGSRKGKVQTVVNTMIVFLLSGLWHGANWTFVFWGFLHGVGVAVNSIFMKKEQITGIEKKKVIGKRMAQIATFVYVCLAFVFFRSDSMADGMLFMKRLFSFEYNGSIFAIAEAVNVSEIYIVTKVLSMKAPQLLAVVNLFILLVIMAVSIYALFQKRTREIVENCTWKTGFSLKMSILFVWAVISMSGVSTFLYFNF